MFGAMVGQTGEDTHQKERPPILDAGRRRHNESVGLLLKAARRQAMTASPNLGITYPPTFAASFWTFPEYRKGAIVLYSRLQEGLDENESVLASIQHRVDSEYAYARALSQGPIVPCVSDTMFPGSVDDARTGYLHSNALTSQMVRDVIQSTTAGEAVRHIQVAKRLESMIVEPFGKWAATHAERVRQSWQLIDASLAEMERQTNEVKKRQSSYEARCWHADEAEDDARFAPGPHVNAMTNGPRNTKDSSPSMKRLSLGQRVASMPETSVIMTATDETGEKEMERPAPASSAREQELQQEANEEPIREGTQESAQQATPSDASGVSHAESVASESQSLSEAEAQKLKRRETLRQQFGFKARKPSESSHPSETNETSPHERQKSRFSSYWNLTMERVQDSQALAQVRAAVTGLSEPRHVRLRREAEAAEKAYRDAIVLQDKLRCRAEEILIHEYKLSQKWEFDRAVAIQRVLVAWEQAMRALSGVTDDDKLSRTDRAPMDPAVHIQHLVMNYRTGPFRPVAVVFKPYYHDDLFSVAGMTNGGFGMDLMAAAKGAALSAHTATTLAAPGSSLTMPTLPPVFHALLSALQRSYAERSRWIPKSGVSTDETIHAEKRRIWLYDVPLVKVHELRESLSDFYDQNRGMNVFESTAPDQLLDTIDAPVLAATVKLWLLELNSPLLPYSVWDEVVTIYEAARIRFLSLRKEASEHEHQALVEPLVQGLSTVLSRLPKLHLTCLDSLVAHFYKLVKNTPTEETEDVYLSKLGLAIGRAVLRPNSTLPSLVFSDYPALLLRDLVMHYEVLLPPLMRQKAKESDMKGLSPYRQSPLLRHRSMLVDERIKRSSLQSLGPPPNDMLQRRFTQIESRHSSAPHSRTASAASRASSVGSNGRVVSLNHLQLDISPVQAGPAASTKSTASETPTKPSCSSQNHHTPNTTSGTEHSDIMASMTTPTPIRISEAPAPPPKMDSPGTSQVHQARQKLFETASDAATTSAAASTSSLNLASDLDSSLEMPKVAPEPTPSTQASAQPAVPDMHGTTPVRPRQSHVRGPRGPRQVS